MRRGHQKKRTLWNGLGQLCGDVCRYAGNMGGGGWRGINCERADGGGGSREEG